MLAKLMVRTATGRALVRRANAQRAADIVGDVGPHLAPGGRALDIGSGTCDVGVLLRSSGVDVTLCDVEDLSCVEGVRPTLYDGRTLPWPDDAFDVALLVNVLHHVPDPDALLREATRVAPRLIIHEDIYDTPRQRALTQVMDSLTNLEFFGHPHTNRDDAGWRRTFEALGLRVVHAGYKRFWRYFSNGNYVVERPPRAVSGPGGAR